MLLRVNSLISQKKVPQPQGSQLCDTERMTSSKTSAINLLLLSGLWVLFDSPAQVASIKCHDCFYRIDDGLQLLPSAADKVNCSCLEKPVDSSDCTIQQVEGTGEGQSNFCVVAEFNVSTLDDGKITQNATYIRRFGMVVQPDTKKDRTCLRKAGNKVENVNLLDKIDLPKVMHGNGADITAVERVCICKNPDLCNRAFDTPGSTYSSATTIPASLLLPYCALVTSIVISQTNT